METKTQNGELLTKEQGVATETGKSGEPAAVLAMAQNVTLSKQDAEEFRQYKKQKRIAEVLSAIAKSETPLLKNEDAKRICERAVRLHQAAVKIPLTRLAQAKAFLTDSKVKFDCIVGGTGETLTRVKAFEAKLALRRGAKEITVMVTPSHVACCRYTEIKKELKRLRRRIGKADLKVCVEGAVSWNALARLARVASEAGASHFSVRYFEGCEKLRLDLLNGCQLEVSGVETLSVFKKLIRAGVGRIVTEKVWEFYSEWIREAEKLELGVAENTTERKSGIPIEAKPVSNGETEEKSENAVIPVPTAKPSSIAPCRCRLEGSDLKFL
ncbi:MAG: hypothetical protein IJV85_03505 [Clostridia bacterium]|nr:hypothetical protein [Clostridia bacterium]